MKRLTLHDLELPRKGRRLSITPGPFPRPQRLWMKKLPWRVYAELIDDRAETMKLALGCHDGSEEADKAFEWVISQMSEGRLLLRVIELSDKHCVPPGNTTHEMQARMDRWMSPGWKFNAEVMLLQWTRPIRFACPSKNIQIGPFGAPLFTEDENVEHDILLNFLQTDGAIARWLNNGQVWVFFYDC